MRKKSVITKCVAREIFDTRGEPTVEVEMRAGDCAVVASVPSGKSTGSREAVVKRDADGGGVSSAIKIIHDVVAPAITGLAPDPRVIDSALCDLDGTPDKRALGANAMLPVSVAAVKLAAALVEVPLWSFIASYTRSGCGMPTVYMNVINGGAHADFRLPFQEYMIVADSRDISDSVRRSFGLFEKLGDVLYPRGGRAYGDEGGYAPSFRTLEKPFEILRNLVAGEKGVSVGIDAAASQLYRDGAYAISGKAYAADELLELYERIVGEFGVASIEDPFEEEDMGSFRRLVELLGGDATVVGDDATVTNPERIETYARAGALDAVIIKPNQIGTVTETFHAIRAARENELGVIVSHRSGETPDTFIADLAVGVGADGFKAGSPLQEERRVKYYRLLEIKKEM